MEVSGEEVGMRPVDVMGLGGVQEFFVKGSMWEGVRCGWRFFSGASWLPTATYPTVDCLMEGGRWVVVVIPASQPSVLL